MRNTLLALAAVATFASVANTAQAADYAVLLGDTQHQPDREERYAQMLRRNEADGLIVANVASSFLAPTGFSEPG